MRMQFWRVVAGYSSRLRYKKSKKRVMAWEHTDILETTYNAEQELYQYPVSPSTSTDSIPHVRCHPQ